MRRPRRKFTSLLNNLCVSETEVVIPKGPKDEEESDKDLHTAYRSLLGSINWLQSKTQFRSCYQFSRCASAAASPTIGHCKTPNKLCRQIVGGPMELMFWPRQGDPRHFAMPDAAFRNTTMTNLPNMLWSFSMLNLEETRVETPKDL